MVMTSLDCGGLRVVRFQQLQYEEGWGETARCSRLIDALKWPKYRAQEGTWRLPFKRNSGCERETGWKRVPLTDFANARAAKVELQDSLLELLATYQQSHPSQVASDPLEFLSVVPTTPTSLGSSTRNP